MMLPIAAASAAGGAAAGAAAGAGAGDADADADAGAAWPGDCAALMLRGKEPFGPFSCTGDAGVDDGRSLPLRLPEEPLRRNGGGAIDDPVRWESMETRLSEASGSIPSDDDQRNSSRSGGDKSTCVTLRRGRSSARSSSSWLRTDGSLCSVATAAAAGQWCRAAKVGEEKEKEPATY